MIEAWASTASVTGFTLGHNWNGRRLRVRDLGGRCGGRAHCIPPARGTLREHCGVVAYPRPGAAVVGIEGLAWCGAQGLEGWAWWGPPEQLALVRSDVDTVVAWARQTYTPQLLTALAFLPAPARLAVL